MDVWPDSSTRAKGSIVIWFAYCLCIDLKSASKTRFQTLFSPTHHTRPYQTHVQWYSSTCPSGMVLLLCRTRPMSIGSKENPDVRRSPRVVSRQQKAIRYRTLSFFVQFNILFPSMFYDCWLSPSFGFYVLPRWWFTRSRRGQRDRYLRPDREASGLGIDEYRELTDTVTAI